MTYCDHTRTSMLDLEDTLRGILVSGEEGNFYTKGGVHFTVRAHLGTFTFTVPRTGQQRAGIALPDATAILYAAVNQGGPHAVFRT